MRAGIDGHFRPEIQGLRAIAVGMVLVYHLWPHVLPGGYTGVDVFFVISGYLITSLLLRELDRSGRISLPRFYVRRARRLLPAALATLLAILVATAFLLPVTQREGVAQEVMAAALYFENWWLAAQAVDYLAIGTSPSPVQHFWSLSIEEQYYFVWPVALAGLYLLVGRTFGTKEFRRSFLVFTAFVIAVSLAYSIYSGISGSAASYFSSFTRIWQLAVGGMVAALPAAVASPRRAYLLVAGLVGILCAGLVLDATTAYPGYAALLPTLATALAIHAGGAYTTTVATRWLGARPVEYLGDISYSLYLWHWPVIVFAKQGLGIDSLGLWSGLAVLLISLVLAALSKRYIEDAFRFGQAGPRAPAWKVLVVAALGSLSCVGLGWGLILATADDSQPAALMVGSSDYPGAAVMLDGAKREVPDLPFIPALVNVNGDVATAYAERCIPNISGMTVQKCEYGNPNAAVRIAVVGDSHAVHWFPAFQELARRFDIRVVGIAKNACMTSGLPVYNGALNRPYTECNAWTRNVIDYLKRQDFDYIVLSQSPGHYVDGHKEEGKAANAKLIAAGMVEVWSELDGKDSKIALFRSTPWQPTEVRDCVAGKSPPYQGCTAPPAKALFDDAISQLARLKHYPLIDFTDLFCTADDCPAVIGNVFVYRDSHHVTATYMRTLAPMVASRLEIRAARVDVGDYGTSSLPMTRPSLSDAAADRGEGFARGCVRSQKQTSAEPCIYGERDSGIRVAVVGDATGANLIPGLHLAGLERGWKVEGYFKDSCLFSRVAVIQRRTKKAFEECSRWTESVFDRIRESPPQLILLAQSPQYTYSRSRSPVEAMERLAEGMAPLVSHLIAGGSKVAVVRYTPWLPFNAPECLQTRRDLSGCAADRKVSLRDGALRVVADEVKDVSMIDLTDEFCDEHECPPVSGDTLIYRDAFQPTATFSRTLHEELGRQVAEVLRSGE